MAPVIYVAGKDEVSVDFRSLSVDFRSSGTVAPFCNMNYSGKVLTRKVFVRSTAFVLIFISMPWCLKHIVAFLFHHTLYRL